MAIVEFRQIAKEYGSTTVLHDVNLTIEEETFAVIFGLPASGKSVLLRLLTGLEKPTSGQIFLHGEDATHLAPGDRNIGYVPQSFALYPHYKVYDNIAYPLKLMNVDSHIVRERVELTAEQLKISHLLKKSPDQLSGGEKQRVAIARGIVKDTQLFVLDDPLIGLDFKLREQLFEDLRQMQEDLEATFIYTTSDPLETLMLAKQVAILHDGTLVESGPLEEVHENPQHLHTMRSLGFPKSSVLPGTVDRKNGRAVCHTPVFDFPVELDSAVTLPVEVQAVVRPRDILLRHDGTEHVMTHESEIVLLEDLGGELVVYLESSNISLVSVQQHDEAHPLTEGPATVAIDPSTIMLFQAGTGYRIGQGTN